MRLAMTDPGKPVTRSRVVATLLGAALLLAARTCVASDDWTGGDKRAHFTGGFIVGGIFAAHTGARGPGVLMGCGVGVFAN